MRIAVPLALLLLLPLAASPATASDTSIRINSFGVAAHVCDMVSNSQCYVGGSGVSLLSYLGPPDGCGARLLIDDAASTTFTGCVHFEHTTVAGPAKVATLTIEGPGMQLTGAGPAVCPPAALPGFYLVPLAGLLQFPDQPAGTPGPAAFPALVFAASACA